MCEWAQKLLDQSFSGLRDLAEHLVGNLYVGSKSVAAFTIIAAMQESGSQNGKSKFEEEETEDFPYCTYLQLECGIIK